MNRFVCSRCGNCCRWEGCVKVNDAEIDSIAAFLGIPVGEFLEHHTRLSPDRKHLSLLENPDGSCQWLKEEESASGRVAVCMIDPVKPQQCRDFPVKWNFPDWQQECGGHFEEKQL